MSLSATDGTPINFDINEMTVSGDIDVNAVGMDGVNKVVNTVKNNKRAVIVGVAGGVALIAIIAFVCSKLKVSKRRKR